MTRSTPPRLPTEVVERAAAERASSSGAFAAPDEARLVGQTLAGRYRIEAPIAGGAMGHVYRATQLPFERTVAVKVLYCGDDGDTNRRFRRRFEREASIAAQLAHPNIITIIDYGETDAGDVFMAMEYLEGVPLYRALQEQGPLPPRRALNIALQVARALRRAHGLGVVHRDLKPANIMIRPDDDGLDFVKVLDFGLVKVFAPEAAAEEVPDGITDEHLTSVGSMMGTPGYMAPEQAVGERIDGRADIYALAVILFQMLSGRLPFAGDSIVDLIRAQVMKPAPFVRELEPDVEISDELEAIIHKCLDKSRDKRVASVDELLSLLKSVWRLETDHSFGTEASLPPYQPRLEQMTVKAAAIAERVGGREAPALPPVPVAQHRLTSSPMSTLTEDAPAPVPQGAWRGAIVVMAVVALLAALGALGIVSTQTTAPVGGLVDLPDEPAPPAAAAPTPEPAPEPLPEGDAPAAGGEPPAEGDPLYKDNPY